MNPCLIISHRKGYPYQTCEVRLNDDAVKLINSEEIVFINNPDEMSIRIPEFDANKTCRIHHYVLKSKRERLSKYASRFFVTLSNADEVMGKYSLEKEGDDIFLIKTLN